MNKKEAREFLRDAGFPDEEKLEKICQKAREEGISVAFMYAPPSAPWQKKQEGVVEALSGTEDSILLFIHALMLNRAVVNAADPALDSYRKYLVSERGCTEAEATEFLQTAEVHRALRELELVEIEAHPQLKDFKHSMEEELLPYAVLPDGSREYVREVSREEADRAVSEAVDRLVVATEMSAIAEVGDEELSSDQIRDICLEAVEKSLRLACDRLYGGCEEENAESRLS